MNEEFESQVKIVRTEPSVEVKVGGAPSVAETDLNSSASKVNDAKKAKAETKKSTKDQKVKEPVKEAAKIRKSKVKGTQDTSTATLKSREPDIEDHVGFIGRRPEKDPFVVGENVEMAVSYFKIKAGTLNLKVEPFGEVNGRKSYTLVTEVRTGSFFSHIYTADDRVETFLDYEDMTPHTYSLHVKESGQLREARCFFDHKTNQATFWEKKYTEKNGHEERKLNWEILPYSQNVFSAIFYMRTFQWEVGKTIAFRVAHDDENIVFKGTAIREEKLETEAGTFDAIVIKPEFHVKGAFKPVGDIYFWLAKNDRKYVLRIESSIKIGTLVAEAVKIIPGK